jgi:nitrate reductase molybdenum cofactor assembly chaperone
VKDVEEKSAWQAWSDLLSYPGEGRAELLGTWIDEVLDARPDLAGELAPLQRYVRTHAPGELEELFVRTFENNAERALELGWHLHGENYARGQFMVRLRGLLRDHAVAESRELPDHLTHVLSIIARAEPELARALARQVVLPALEKIVAGFDTDENPYRGAASALARHLREELGAPQAEVAI